MSLKGTAKSLSLVALAVAFPLFILYSIFKPAARPQTDVQELANIERGLSELPDKDYRVHSVQDDGGILRVNILLDSEPAGRDEVERHTLNALYDVQSLIGKKQTVSVWTGLATGELRPRLLGVAFFSSITENYSFKSAEEMK